MRRALACLALLAAAACASTPEPLEPPIRVLVLGDSISIGYTPHVREALAGDAFVVRPTRDDGRPENCAGTTKGVEELDRWLRLDGGGWDVIHVNFGLHDLKRVDPGTRANSNDPSDPHQAPPGVYESQLRAIVERLAGTGARVIVATTTPVPEGGVRPHRDPGDVPRYNAIAREIAAEHGAAVNDLYAFALERQAEIQRPVDVHFTQEGSRLLGEQVAEAIRAAAGWGG